MCESAIRFENVTYVYGKGSPFLKTAVDHVDLEIKKGKITGIIGHTGSGKSTLLQLMNGLLTPDEGKVYLFGRDINADKKKMREIAFSVGLVFQYPEYQLFEETVGKDVAFGPKNMGLSDSEIEERVAKALNFVGMGREIVNASPFELSGGQKRRVAIAGILAMEPEVLVLDEPAAGLDPRGREEIFGNIRSYQKTTGKTVVIVSHSMEDMAKYAEDLAVMSRGKILCADSCENVFANRKLLEEVNLDVPQITVIMDRLKELGMPVPENVFTVEKAREALLPLLSGGEKNA